MILMRRSPSATSLFGESSNYKGFSPLGTDRSELQKVRITDVRTIEVFFIQCILRFEVMFLKEE